MTNLAKTLVAVFMILAIISCSAKKESVDKVTQKTKITVYGSNECDHCLEFKAELDKANLVYTFYDVNQSEQRSGEMMMKIRALRIEGNIALPVVEVGDRLFIAPKIEQVLKITR